MVRACGSVHFHLVPQAKCGAAGAAVLVVFVLAVVVDSAMVAAAVLAVVVVAHDVDAAMVAATDAAANSLVACHASPPALIQTQAAV